MSTQVDQNREDEDGRISQDTATPKVGTNQADTRNPYEQQEFQRKNSHLFTTPTQSVNADGSLTTYEQVTTKLREAKDKMVANARMFAAAHDFSADYWFLMDELSDTKKHVDYIDGELKKCLEGFTKNYALMHERHHRVSDLVLDDQEVDDGSL